MKEIQNNAFFWQKIDTLIVSSNYHKQCKVGDHHAKYNHLIYPVEYGHLMDAEENDKVVGKVYKGSAGYSCDALIVLVDILDKELDVRLLVGCSEDEKQACLEFCNMAQSTKTILVSRSDEMPSWAIDD